MLCMMPVAVLTIVLGLALLIFAAGLFLRASKKSGPSGAAEPTGSPDATAVPAPGPVAGRWSRSVPSVPEPLPDGDPVPVTGGADRGIPDAGTTGTGDAAVAGPADPVPDADPVPAPAAEPEPVAAAREPAPEAAPAPTSEPAPAAPAAPAPSGHTSLAGRRARRQWAAAHGFEYTREDRYLTPEWPVSLLHEISPDRVDPPARDLVSGFVDGHQVHIADVAGTTLVALRRSESSPVDVHFTTVAAMPAGMRHSELCDCPPFTGYSTDNRALDRMLDARVTGTLRDLAPYACDVVFSGAWLVAQLSGRAEAEVWERMLPQLALLGDAARVLPPRVTSTELDMPSADPTRPRPASGAHVDLAAGGSRDGAGGAYGADSAAGAAGAPGTAGSPQQPAARGHLRAVPDAPQPDTSPDSAPDTVQPAEAAAEEPSPSVHVNRPTEPVDFPTRSEARNFGDTSGMSDAAADLWNPDETQEGIPVVGDDDARPRQGRGAHTADPSSDAPRIVRGYSEATIFTDGSDDSDGSDGTDGGDADGSGVGGWAGDIPELSAPQGRHRAPDARHSDGSDDGEDNDEVVDAEIVDPDDLHDPDNPGNRGSADD